MRTSFACLLLAATVAAQDVDKDKTNQAVKPGDSTALTIYNQGFAVVRQPLSLELKAGTNQVEVTDITAHVEPDSVILRDLKSGRDLRILEQNYRNDVASQARLLALYEGKTIDFLVTDKDNNRRLVPGRVIRSGYQPHYEAYSAYGGAYAQGQQAYVAAGSGEPLIEVEGKLQFTLPGLPVFPALADDTILKPTLSWLLHSDQSGVSEAEFSYVTAGMSWHADYNVVAPVNGNALELVGWVTFDNQTGKSFPSARIKQMAGDVNKIQPGGAAGYGNAVGAIGFAREERGPAVTERSFDEYHLYTLERPTALRDRETKQVEFVRAAGIPSQRVYVYDGMKVDPNYRNYPMESIRQMESFGIESNPKVWVMQEFVNSKANHLGMPLPKGRVRFYRRDNDGQLEFTGENEIDHTPADEKIRLYTGNAFDAVGERRRVSFRVDYNARWIDETFEIKVRNHKKTPIEVRVVEHFYRCVNWEISKNTQPFNKMDSKTIEFRVQAPPDGEQTVSYMVHYTW